MAAAAQPGLGAEAAVLGAEDGAGMKQQLDLTFVLVKEFELKTVPGVVTVAGPGKVSEEMYVAGLESVGRLESDPQEYYNACHHGSPNSKIQITLNSNSSNIPKLTSTQRG